MRLFLVLLTAALLILGGFILGISIGAARWQERALAADEAELEWARAIGQREVCLEALARDRR